MNGHVPRRNTNPSTRRGAAMSWMRWVRSPWTRFATLITIVGSVGVGVVQNGMPTLATAQSWVVNFGVWAPLAFVMVYAAATVSLLPMTVLSAVAGTLFGIPIGITVVWCGAMLGSTVAFLLGAGHTRGTVDWSQPSDTWRGFLQRHGTWAIAVTRLVPFAPLGLVNYAFTITPISLRQYVVGTGIGILPVTVALVVLGDQTTSLQSPVSTLVVTALTVCLAGTAMLVPRRHRSNSPNTAYMSRDSAGKDAESWYSPSEHGSVSVEIRHNPPAPTNRGTESPGSSHRAPGARGFHIAERSDAC